MARPVSKPRKFPVPRTFSEAVRRFNREKNPARAHALIPEFAFHLAEILEDVLRFVRDADLPAGRRPRVLSLAGAVEVHWPFHERHITRLLTELEQEDTP